MHARQLSSSQVNQETEAEFIRTRDSLQLGRRLLEDMKGEHKEKVDECYIKWLNDVGDDWDDGNRDNNGKDNYNYDDYDE